MESERSTDGDGADPGDDRADPGNAESTDKILEALLVDDAEVRWDPVSGKPGVARRGKSDLDSQAPSE